MWPVFQSKRYAKEQPGPPASLAWALGGRSTALGVRGSARAHFFTLPDGPGGLVLWCVRRAFWLIYELFAWQLCGAADRFCRGHTHTHHQHQQDYGRARAPAQHNNRASAHEIGRERFIRPSSRGTGVWRESKEVMPQVAGVCVCVFHSTANSRPPHLPPIDRSLSIDPTSSTIQCLDGCFTFHSI